MSGPVKIGFFGANLMRSLSLRPELAVRFRLLAFHAAAVLWHLWLNYRTFLAVWQIFKNRRDLVDKTCGYGTQYITIWNQVVIQLYFAACLLQDVLDVWRPRHHVPVQDRLRKVIPYYFASFAFPMSFVVSINFWVFYSLSREIVDEDNIMETFIPEWINHGLHTIIVFLVCMEMILVHRLYPSRAQTFFGVCALVTAYAATCTVLYAVSGFWPYPLVRDMTAWGKAFFLLSNCILGVILVAVGEALNRKIWGEAPLAAKATEKKVS